MIKHAAESSDLLTVEERVDAAIAGVTEGKEFTEEQMKWIGYIREHFEEFEERYGDDPNGNSKRRQTGNNGRWRKFSISEIKERNYKLDITWLRDESLEDADDLPEPGVPITDAITELEAVVDDLREMAEMIELNGTRS